MGSSNSWLFLRYCETETQTMDSESGDLEMPAACQRKAELNTGAG